LAIQKSFIFESQLLHDARVQLTNAHLNRYLRILPVNKNIMNNTIRFTPSRFIALLGATAALLAGSLLFAASGARADTASSTPPIISSVITTPSDTGATITWLTDQPSGTQVLYGLTSSYSASTTLDTTKVTSHTAFLGGLVPNTTYHFELQSGNASGTLATSSDRAFMTASSSTATTTTNTGNTGSTTTDMLQAEITALQARVSALEAAVFGINGGGGTGTTTSPTGTAMIDQNGSTIAAGSSVDLSGRNFGHEENVTVSLNGTTLATAHADGGGNFSTGSIPGPTIPGMYVYHFVGQNSGISATASVTVH
jgi:hypothetical protein